MLCIVYGIKSAAAGTLAVLADAETHRHTGHGITILFEEQSGDRRIHTAAHGYKDFFPHKVIGMIHINIFFV
jgi:hypothetical protein